MVTGQARKTSIYLVEFFGLYDVIRCRLLMASASA